MATTPPLPAGSIEQYTAYMQDLGNIGVRHENSRNFYLSVVSALFVFLAMAGKQGFLASLAGPVRILVGLFGLVLCAVWVMHMRSFGAIYRAKFDVLSEMERLQGLFPISDQEWKYKSADPRYQLLTLIDSLIPLLFAILFVVLLFLG